MAPIRVGDVMTQPVLSTGPDSDIATVIELMHEKRIRHVPVVDEHQNVIGVVSHRDLLRGALKPTSPPEEEVRGLKVRDLMAHEVEVIDASENISTAAQMMLASKYGCLPVVDGTRLSGILTEADFVRYLAEHR